MSHFSPGIRKNSFAHYDYNDVQRNMVAYRQSTAPAYNPALIPKNLPVLVVSGGRDWTAPALGLSQFVSQLRGPAQSINLTNYAHYDLTFSANREKDIYLPIVSFLESSQFDGESSELPGL
jgi:lysosomal acid lipase/cholesteryl ester hydrolase